MRGKKSPRKPITPDPIYKSKAVTRMVNSIMLAGKKSTAQKAVYGAISMLSDDRKEALSAFEDAIKKVMPAQEVRSRRVGGATYQVPTPVKHERSEALAVRWIIDAARAKKGKPIIEKLHEELKNAHEGVGSAIKKRDDTHKMADANRAFAHFARF